METNKTDISSISTCDSILKHIINCANAALQNEDAFQKAMLELASELRKVFDSDFCSIGIVSDGYAEDCIRSYKEFEDEELSEQQKIFLKSFKRASLDEDTYIVCKALKLNKNIFFPQEEINQFNNNKYYPSILTSGHLIDSYVFPLRDKEKKIFGYIQFINSKKDIDYQRAIFPYSDALLGLVQIIIKNRENHQELVKRDNLLKDADFYNLMQEKRDNVDELLDSIMEYFSGEFNAAVISFRIPILNDYNKVPIFYLRDIYIHTSIGDNKYNDLKEHYYSDRLVKNKTDICSVDKLKYSARGEIIISESETDFSKYGLDLEKNTLLIPIFRDFNNFINPQRKESGYREIGELQHGIEQFDRLYGIFRLRISKTNLSKQDSIFQYDIDETTHRLKYLSKQITLLFNSIVDKHETESLKVFQYELKNSSFIKIQDFDKRCVEIIQKAVHAKVCSIYRYDNETNCLLLSATTAERIQFHKNRIPMYFPLAKVMNKCLIRSNATNNLILKTYNNSPNSLYVFNIYDTHVHQFDFVERIQNANEHESALAVPIIKKDGTCDGVVLLLGKKEHKHSISTSFWEHDINHIDFIVNVLIRISESDSERLTFLSQLSHELLAPVTELVYDNDLTIDTAERNIESYSKRFLIAKIRENIDSNLLFKYIISDTEFIYSASGRRNIDYNIVKHDHPQDILLVAIRLLEKEAHDSKGLSIITYIKEMPPLHFDKERIMQVFLNLLKNAIRYADNHTQISVSYDKRNDGLHEIQFTNVGIGIRKEEKESIFKLFYRGKEAKKRFVRGTGMGLYIVRDIMKAHGGNCYVKNLDNPTVFAITFPNNVKSDHFSNYIN